MCSNLNNLLRQIPFKGGKIADLVRGITLANSMVVKKAVTYREITVAIGILVAMVIALTLWINKPGEKITEVRAQHRNIPSVDLRTQLRQSLQDLSSDFYR